MSKSHQQTQDREVDRVPYIPFLLKQVEKHNLANIIQSLIFIDCEYKFFLHRQLIRNQSKYEF